MALSIGGTDSIYFWPIFQEGNIPRIHMANTMVRLRTSMYWILKLKFPLSQVISMSENVSIATTPPTAMSSITAVRTAAARLLDA